MKLMIFLAIVTFTFSSNADVNSYNNSSSNQYKSKVNIKASTVKEGSKQNNLTQGGPWGNRRNNLTKSKVNIKASTVKEGSKQNNLTQGGPWGNRRNNLTQGGPWGNRRNNLITTPHRVDKNAIKNIPELPQYQQTDEVNPVNSLGKKTPTHYDNNRLVNVKERPGKSIPGKTEIDRTGGVDIQTGKATNGSTYDARKLQGRLVGIYDKRRPVVSSSLDTSRSFNADGTSSTVITITLNHKDNSRIVITQVSDTNADGDLTSFEMTTVEFDENGTETSLTRTQDPNAAAGNDHPFYFPDNSKKAEMPITTHVNPGDPDYKEYQSPSRAPIVNKENLAINPRTNSIDRANVPHAEDIRKTISGPGGFPGKDPRGQ